MVSLLLTVFLVIAYDRHFLPFAKRSTVNLVTSERAFGVTNPNPLGATLVVSISATNIRPAFTMCGSVAPIKDSLPHGLMTNGCSNGTTVAAVSFSGEGRNSSITFVVPPGYYYSVTVDSPDIHVSFWTEFLL